MPDAGFGDGDRSGMRVGMINHLTTEAGSATSAAHFWWVVDFVSPSMKRPLHGGAEGFSHQGARVTRTIASVRANDDWTLEIVFADGEARRFDLKPWLTDEAFEEWSDPRLFKRFKNQGYFIEWENGADLSADTLFYRATPSPPDR